MGSVFSATTDTGTPVSGVVEHEHVEVVAKSSEAEVAATAAATAAAQRDEEEVYQWRETVVDSHTSQSFGCGRAPLLSNASNVLCIDATVGTTRGLEL